MAPNETPGVAFVTPEISLELESAVQAEESAQIVAAKAINAKCPAADLSGPGVNPCGGFNS